jgi:hypothetical protein
MLFVLVDASFTQELRNLLGAKVHDLFVEPAAE